MGCKLCSFFSKPTPEPEPTIIPDTKDEKYALLVGINKYRPALNCDLRGCCNDVANLRAVLIDKLGWNSDNIRVLLDERATKQNIVDRLLWLVGNENSELVFQYSGHGSQVRDRSGDELNDGLDEILCPTDMDFDNPLTDDTLDQIFSGISEGSFLTCLIDSCHSGSVTRDINNPTESKPRYLAPPRDIQFRSESKELPTKKIGSKSIELNHMLLSGCRDDQTSSDAYIDGIWQGAFTHNLIKHIHPAKTWNDIYSDVLLDVESGGFSQVPQFNGKNLSGRPIFGGI